ncbi:hypothetical protein TNCT_603891 [Trichonephila clavata]|uniref:RNase H type-1 domain-containing protein n=1 Tax=Trichonephila clavata TaxID=2740835 RepID=A0A8X6HMK1_TRICU|nr:hypothetical protein TNCT_603891 [Trichonephila clavata]
MSVSEFLKFFTDSSQPTVIEILLLLRKLERKGFDRNFCLIPGHGGKHGNELVDNIAGSLTGPIQQLVCYQDLTAPVLRYIHCIWQEIWDQQVINK